MAKHPSVRSQQKLARGDVQDYVSTDTAVIAVTKQGRVTAMAPGNASVYAVANGINGRSQQITVIAP